MWSIILIKDFYLFKIAESIFSFYLKLHNFKQVSLLLEWWTMSLVHHEDLIISLNLGSEREMVVTDQQ